MQTLAKSKKSRTKRTKPARSLSSELHAALSSTSKVTNPTVLAAMALEQNGTKLSKRQWEEVLVEIEKGILSATVNATVKYVHPFAVDVLTSVETIRGDIERMRAALDQLAMSREAGDEMSEYAEACISAGEALRDLANIEQLVGRTSS